MESILNEGALTGRRSPRQRPIEFFVMPKDAGAALKGGPLGTYLGEIKDANDPPGEGA